MILETKPQNILRKIGATKIIADSREYMINQKERAESITRTIIMENLLHTIDISVWAQWQSSDIDLTFNIPNLAPLGTINQVYLYCDFFSEQNIPIGTARFFMPFTDILNSLIAPNTCIILTCVAVRIIGATPTQFPSPITILPLEITRP
jgi:hypothetical protein